MLKKIVLTSSLVCGAFNASAMTLDEYLSAVEENSLTYKAAKAQAEGSEYVIREADLLTSPKLFAMGRSSSDNKLPSPPTKLSDKTRTDTLQVGVSQTFDFGLDLKLSVLANKHNFIGYTGQGGGKYWDAQPAVEFTMPLWAGGFGRLVKAQKEVTKKQNQADAYSSRALSLQTLMQAENAFWSLSLAQERIKIQEKGLAAARNIYNYVNRQKSKNLGETADVLQASALVEGYQLQVKQASNELERSRRQFNLFLNKDSNSAVEELENANYKNLLALKFSATRPGDRYDVLAQKAQTELVKASSDLILERNRPQLNLMGGYTMQGRDRTDSFDAVSNSFDNDRHARYIGLQFQVPLNLKALSDARTGAQRLKDAADIRDANINYTQDQEWIDLREKLSESQSALELTMNMERAQRLKLENERVRLRQGRTTTYQVLLFEQDYTNAQASTLSLANQIVAYNAQLKLYQANPKGDK